MIPNIRNPRARSLSGSLKVAFLAVIVFAGLAAQAVGGDPPARRIDLAGVWRCQLDPEDQGAAEQWYRLDAFEHTVHLPGSLTENGLGDEITVDTPWTGSIVDRSWFTEPQYAPYREPGQVKVPFWLTPLKYYKGAAWYTRLVRVPPGWKDQRVELFLERCHWQTRVWVDGQAVGSRDSLSCPHVYNLGALEAGVHRITICVDNRVKIGVGVNAHSVSDHTQGNWNGIVGRLELRARPRVWIEDVQVWPDLDRRAAVVRMHVGNATGGEIRGMVALEVRPHPNGPVLVRREVPLQCPAKMNDIEADCILGDRVALWDEFSPNLYVLRAETRVGVDRDVVETTFGLRRFATQGTQFTINGRKTILRGTLECCIFPKTGYPPTDKAEWRRILRIAKAHGLNHIRFHSWCPPEAAFAAADELGVYFQVECAAWANSGSSIGDGRPIDTFIYAEGDRIIKMYGNHPSFCMLAYGNEPAGGNQQRWLGELVTYWKRKDPRRLYTSAAGWPIIPENDFHSTPAPRIQAWGEGLRSRINARPPETMTDYRDFVVQHEAPVVSHEIGQWCVYPNFDEIAKYTGVFRAANFEIFRDSLDANHMLDQAHDFLIASGKLQALCYKEDIESQLRTPGIGGFQLLDLHDFPGQGTALVGVLDAFWDEKGYITPAEYHRFCGPTVPLLRVAKRVWSADEPFEGVAEIAHFGSQPLDRRCVWRLWDVHGRVVRHGPLPSRMIPIGNGTELGPVRFDWSDVKAPAKVNLEIAVEGTDIANDWDLWVYPPAPPCSVPEGVHVAHALDDAALAVLQRGGRVLLLPARGSVAGDVGIGFSSIFWNTAWTRGQPPHTLGILCDPAHPALAGFPTDSHTNWQWWYLISRSQAMVLDELPPTFRPIVQVIDDWVTNRRLGLLFEAKVAGGRLLACSMDIEDDLDDRLPAKALRESLLEYMVGENFRPAEELRVEDVRGLLRPPRLIDTLGAWVLRTDSHEPGYEGENAIDGNPNTIWHTAWTPTPPDYPHDIVIDLRRPVRLRGLTYLPRQDMRNGWVSRYAVYVSDDPDRWGEPVARGEPPLNRELKTIRFDTPMEGRYVRFVAVAGLEGQRFASVAELDVIAGDGP